MKHLNMTAVARILHDSTNTQYVSFVFYIEKNFKMHHSKEFSLWEKASHIHTHTRSPRRHVFVSVRTNAFQRYMIDYLLSCHVSVCKNVTRDYLGQHLAGGCKEKKHSPTKAPITRGAKMASRVRPAAPHSRLPYADCCLLPSYSSPTDHHVTFYGRSFPYSVHPAARVARTRELNIIIKYLNHFPTAHTLPPAQHEQQKDRRKRDPSAYNIYTHTHKKNPSARANVGDGA